MESPEAWTIGRVLRWTQERFAARGISSPRLDAELLLSSTLGRTRVALYTHFDQPLQKDELARFRVAIQKRLAGTPVAYLIGEKEFYGLPLRVTEATLIPRPETELLVELALGLLPKAAKDAPPQSVSEESAAPEVQIGQAEPGVELHIAYDEPAPELAAEAEAEAEAPAAAPATPATPAAPSDAPPLATVADIGTGSGAVALAVAHQRRDIRVIAIDASADALAVATENAQKLGLKVDFRHGDLLAPLARGEQLDLIVANLPYIPTADIAGLSPEVRSEPRSALDGGPDGLDPIRRLVTQSPRHLRPGGWLALELGQGQAAAVEELLRRAGFVDVRSEADLARIPRVVLGRRPV